MPRQVREANLSSREARKRLAVARKPYYRLLDEGLHLGYRKSVGGGAWVTRWYKGEGAYQIANLDGRPDDILEADGETVLNWTQAQRKARDLFQRKQREMAGLDEVAAGPYTVRDALADYVADYTRRGGKAADRTKATIDALILPALGDTQVDKLSRRKIEAWHSELFKVAPRLRTKPGMAQKFRETDLSAESVRRRQSTANRVLTVLKAALNHALQERKISSDDAWRMVKPFREVDAARVRYLSDDEARRLVNAADPDFRPLIKAALLTGARLGELTRLTVMDFNADAGTVHIRVSKSGKGRHVVLTDEGRRFFTTAALGKSSDALIFARADGGAWGKSQQHRPFKAALKAAGIGEMAFHELRHSYASRLVMRGVPLGVVATQLGHTDSRMVEKHYGHMSASYVADTVRNAFTDMGLVRESNVMPISATGRPQ